MEKYCTQIKIILSVFGDVFDPLTLSEYIKISPTYFWNKGDEISQRKGLIRKSTRVPLRKESAWEYSTDFVKTLYLDEVSKIIIEKFGQKIPEMNKYIYKKGLDIKIDIVVEIVDNQIPAMTFNRDFLKLANQLEAEIDIDVYLISND